MKSRLIMLMSLAVAALSLSLAAGRMTYSMSGPPPPVHASLPPKPHSYLGVYEKGSPPDYQPIAEFASSVGRKPNLAESFSGWAEPFDTAYANVLHSHGITPLVQIDPTDALLGEIAAGNYDDYLRPYADAVADYGHPVIIGFGQEMNAPWFPWGFGHVSASTFVAAWQHLWRVFRSEGADNVTWLWTIQADEPGTGPIADWWPGARYVSWVGIDGFYNRPSDTFASVFQGTITTLRTFTSKPVLLSETAVGPNAGPPVIKIPDLFRGVIADKLLGLVWFDVDQSAVPTIREDWRIERDYQLQTWVRVGVQDLDLASGGG
jgi:mannan endo-1,4-beta-mannosidase